MKPGDLVRLNHTCISEKRRYYSGECGVIVGERLIPWVSKSDMLFTVLLNDGPEDFAGHLLEAIDEEG